MVAKVIAAFLFVALFLGGLLFVAQLNAAFLLRDAVFTLDYFATFFAALLSPSALVAICVLVFARASVASRGALAFGFAAATALATEALLAADQTEFFSSPTEDIHLGWFVGINVGLVCLFVAAGALTQWQTRLAETRAA